MPALSNARLNDSLGVMDRSKSTRHVATSYESWLLQCARQGDESVLLDREGKDIWDPSTFSRV